MKYLEFSVFCPDELKDIIQAELSQIGFEGFWDYHDQIIGYVPQNQYDIEQIKEVLIQYHLIESYSIKEVENINWNATWESEFQPIVVDEKVYIRAHFHIPNPNYLEIVITPKMSFGTGHHATTYNMVSLMLDIDFKSKKVLDMGSGTGILGILAEKLGADHVLGIDNEDFAFENCKENIINNECNHFEIILGNENQIPNQKFDIILSNINRNINKQLISTYKNILNHDGLLILSGFYDHDKHVIIEEANNNGLKFVNEKIKEDWIALVLKAQ